LKKKILSVFKFLFFLAIGAVLLWLALRGKDLHKSLIEIENADYRWVAVSIIVMLMAHLVRALRWNQLIRTLDIKTRADTTFYAVMIGYFVSNAVPRLGEISRCGILSRYHRAPLNAVIGTVIVERAFDVITMFVILMITVFSQLQFIGDFFGKTILDPITTRFSSNTSAMLILGGGFLLFCIICFVVYRLSLPRLRKLKLFHKILDIIKGFWEGVKAIKKIKHKYLFLFYSILMWFLYTLTIYFCFLSMSATKDMAFIDALTIMAMGSIGTLVPTPGGIGAYQYFVTITLIALFAVEKNTASAFANMVYFSQWFLVIIVGGLSWAMMVVLQKKVKKDENN